MPNLRVGKLESGSTGVYVASAPLGWVCPVCGCGVAPWLSAHCKTAPTTPEDAAEGTKQ